MPPVANRGSAVRRRPLLIRITITEPKSARNQITHDNERFSSARCDHFYIDDSRAQSNSPYEQLSATSSRVDARFATMVAGGRQCFIFVPRGAQPSDRPSLEPSTALSRKPAFKAYRAGQRTSSTSDAYPKSMYASHSGAGLASVANDCQPTDHEPLDSVHCVDAAALPGTA